MKVETIKALPDVVVTFDRLSTREELKQVLDLLSDVNSPRNLEIVDLPEESGDLGPQGEPWSEMADSEHAQGAELGTLANLFLGRHERTN